MMKFLLLAAACMMLFDGTMPLLFEIQLWDSSVYLASSAVSWSLIPELT
jgi:hypothetical protein